MAAAAAAGVPGFLYPPQIVHSTRTEYEWPVVCRPFVAPFATSFLATSTVTATMAIVIKKVGQHGTWRRGSGSHVPLGGCENYIYTTLSHHFSRPSARLHTTGKGYGGLINKT